MRESLAGANERMEAARLRVQHSQERCIAHGRYSVHVRQHVVLNGILSDGKRPRSRKRLTACKG